LWVRRTLVKNASPKTFVQEYVPVSRIPLAARNENFAPKQKNTDQLAADLKRLKVENSRLTERLHRPHIMSTEIFMDYFGGAKSLKHLMKMQIQRYVNNSNVPYKDVEKVIVLTL